jgi:branched-chain amino acid transport system substrate-binding protein
VSDYRKSIIQASPNRRIRRVPWLTGLLVMAVFGLLASSCGSDSDNSPIDIGAVGPLSGLYSIVGLSQEAGVQIAIDELQDGQIDGREVVLHSMDDEVNAEKGVTALNRLIDEHEVVAVFGSTVTFITEAMARVIGGMDEPIPQVGVVGSDDVIYPDGPGTTPREWVYGVLTGNHAGVATLVNYVLDSHAGENVVILHDETLYGQGGNRLAVELFESGGGLGSLASIELPQGTLDPTPQVSRAFSHEPDVFLMLTSQDDAARVALAIHESGDDVQIVCMDTCASLPSYRELAGEAANGTVSWSLAVSINPTPALEEFRSKYQALRPEDGFTPDWAVQSYDMAKILFKVFDDVGTDPVDVKEALGKVRGHKGVSSADLSFGPDRHNALSNLEDYALVVIENGEVVPLAG